jgi:hypothetical protein
MSYNTNSSSPSLDVTALHQVHQYRSTTKLETFNIILKQCHDKIRKYNSEFHKMECYFLPPINVYGKPIYNRTEVIMFIINKLRENGIVAFWDTTKKEIYISWEVEKTSEPPPSSTSENPQITYVAIASESDDHTKTSKKQKKTKKQAVQHMALVDYGGDTKDLIPVNLGKQ